MFRWASDSPKAWRGLAYSTRGKTSCAIAKRRGLAVNDGCDVVEPGQMMLAQLGEPVMQPVKRQAMRRQHQRIRRQRLEPRQRIQILLHRVGLRLRRRRDHRWRHVRQDLIARDQDFVVLAKEQRMFGRMPARRDHPPLALAHGDHVAVPNAGEFARRPQAQKFRLALRFHDPGGIIVRRAVSLHEGGKMLVRSFLALMPHLPAAEPFGQRHANRAFHFLHQVSGEAEMIDMRMREGEVLQRAARSSPRHSLSQISKVSSVFMPQSTRVHPGPLSSSQQLT